jgi:hypothetical protein
LCLDPDAPASSSIVLKALRAHTPAAGKDERDRNIRAALRKRVLDEALEAAAAPEHAGYPGMGERWGHPREDQLAVRISADGFHRLTEKIVRGIFYVVDQKFIEPPFVVESFPLDPSTTGPIREVPRPVRRHLRAGTGHRRAPCGHRGQSELTVRDRVLGAVKNICDSDAWRKPGGSVTSSIPDPQTRVGFASLRRVER